MEEFGKNIFKIIICFYLNLAFQKLINEMNEIF